MLEISCFLHKMHIFFAYLLYYSESKHFPFLAILISTFEVLVTSFRMHNYFIQQAVTCCYIQVASIVFWKADSDMKVHLNTSDIHITLKQVFFDKKNQLIDFLKVFFTLA